MTTDYTLINTEIDRDGFGYYHKVLRKDKKKRLDELCQFSASRLPYL
jgi:hypothetical protein